MQQQQGGKLDKCALAKLIRNELVNITNLSLLGVDIENKTIRIQVGENNDIDLDHLERTLTACFALKHVVPTIMLTMVGPSQPGAS